MVVMKLIFLDLIASLKMVYGCLEVINMSFFHLCPASSSYLKIYFEICQFISHIEQYKIGLKQACLWMKQEQLAKDIHFSQSQLHR